MGLKFVVEDSLATPPLRWPDAETGPWEVRLTWDRRGDSVECVGWSLQPLDASTAKPLTAVFLRSVQVVRLIAQARAARFEALHGNDWESMAEVPEMEEMAQQWGEEAAGWAPPRTGAPIKYGLEHYRTVARVYSEALHRGHKPRRAIARYFGGGPSGATVSRWIARARTEGFLPLTEPGRAVGLGVLHDAGRQPGAG